MTPSEEDELLEKWSKRLIGELEIEGFVPDIPAVLGLAGMAAHAVIRPAAPLTTFLAGFAAGVASAQGAPAEEAATRAIERSRRLCTD